MADEILMHLSFVENNVIAVLENIGVHCILDIYDAYVGTSYDNEYFLCIENDINPIERDGLSI